MRSLFSISDDLLALADLLTEVGGDVSDDDAGAALESWFDALGDERDRKIDAYCALIQEMTARSKAREDEAKRLQRLAVVDLDAVKRLKDRLKAFLDLHGLTKLETARFKVSVAKNGGLSPLIYPGEWEEHPETAPPEWQKRIVTVNLAALREAVEAGQEIPGCSLAERGTHLRIK